ncbi:unnamed protein product [Cladocopium goreaui]|uniref:Uncharacterized protein n=1 Tax=Cladocopium goreaui TaxID=2562237 RepID=A0A9P1GBT7_9DINO|nr:unnamed protein product [Cladocopium goreaui]
MPGSQMSQQPRGHSLLVTPCRSKSSGYFVFEVDRLAVAGEILASAAQVGGSSGSWSPELRVSSRPLTKPSRKRVGKASKEVELLLSDFRQEPPPIAQQLWNQLHLEEQSLKHMQKQLQRLSSAHLRRLERAYVEEAQQNLPDEVSTAMLLLAYLGAMGVFTAGAGCTMNYWSWISSAAIGDYLMAIIGSIAVVSVLEMLRMVLVLCVALARLETRRRATQAKWTRKHPEILEVKATAPLGVGGGNSPRSARRWPGDRGERGERPPVAAVKVTRAASALPSPVTGGFWALPRMLQRRGARVSPERDAEQKSSKRWKFLRRAGELGRAGVRRQVEEREAEQVAAMMNMAGFHLALRSCRGQTADISPQELGGIPQALGPKVNKNGLPLLYDELPLYAEPKKHGLK